MIDWTKPVETTEDPPRPVRVLFDKDGRPEAAYIADNGSSPSVNLFALEHIGTGISATRGMYSIPLRNVAPPKPEPVLREAWVVWDSDGVYKATTEHIETAETYAREEDCIYARAAVMSDGSPVPSEASGEDDEWPGCRNKDHANLEADRDHWKAKYEALQTQIGHKPAFFYSYLGNGKAVGPVIRSEEEFDRITADRNAWKARAEALQVALDRSDAHRENRKNRVDELQAEVERMKPVVDAAVAWASQDQLGRLSHVRKAVRAYQSPHVVAEPVKECNEWLTRAEMAEADLAAARRAIGWLMYVSANENVTTWADYPDHAPAIAAARAEGGE